MTLWADNAVHGSHFNLYGYIFFPEQTKRNLTTLMELQRASPARCVSSLMTSSFNLVEIRLEYRKEASLNGS